MTRPHARLASRDIDRIAASCTAYNLRRADRVISQLYDEALRPAGLRSTQFTLLGSISRHEPVTLSDLADAIAMDRTTLSRNLRPLERDGLLAIEAGDDQRTRQVRLTSNGHRRLARAYRLWREVHGRVELELGVRRTRDLVARLAEAVERLREV